MQNLQTVKWTGTAPVCVNTSLSRKVVRKSVHATIPKGNMGYDQYTVPEACSCRTYFCCFPLALANTFPWPFVPILSNFFEKKRTQNHPQCLSGLSRALFPTTFLEIAVYEPHATLNKTRNLSAFLWLDKTYRLERNVHNAIKGINETVRAF